MNKCKEGKLDDAITVARIVNQELPHLTISSENKALATTLTEVLGTKLETSVNTLTNLTTMLSQLLEKVPEGIKVELATVLSKLDALDSTTSKSSESILQTFSELVNKPTSKGKAGEKTLSQAWSMTYPEDDIDDKGGPGQTDFVVSTPLKNKHMSKMSVERKSGNQKYNSKHVKEAIKHARDEGARYAIVVYDSFENNMPDTYGPLFIDKVEGIVLAITDVSNNGWKMARYVFSVLELNISGIGQEKVDVTKIGQTVKEMYKITEQIALLRKKNNSAVQACESAREAVNTLEQIFEKYMHTLHLNLGELQGGD